MRIIKLSKDEFNTLDDVLNFFQSELYDRKPEGQFRLPSNKLIEKDELLLFSYEKIVRFTGISKTEVLENNDEFSADYPYYFAIDMSSVQSAEMSLEQVEDFLKNVYDKAIVSARAWSKIPDSPTANELWDSLRKK
jgi:hypothetical protein